MCSLWNFPSLAYLLAKFHVSVLPSIFVGRDWRTKQCCAWQYLSIPNKIESEINVWDFVSYLRGIYARFQENMFDCTQHISSHNRKGDWRAVDAPKKRTNECGFFAVKSKNAKNKTNSFFHFLGESTARQSTYGFIWPLTCSGRFLRSKTFKLENFFGI